jgi:hypothetical protein
MMAEKVHSGSPPNPSYTKEHYYYDGVRRIQTVVPTRTLNQRVQAEYVYGRGYVDEFVLQTHPDGDGNQQPVYMLQDANYNVVGLLSGSGTVREQYTWEPYGTLGAVDSMVSPRPDNRVGHQGLFFYRFDGASLAVGARGLYYMRNRWYDPRDGGFMDRDPRATGLSLLGTSFETNSAFWEGGCGSASEDCGCSSCGCGGGCGCGSECGGGAPEGNCCSDTGQVAVSPRIQYADGMNLQTALASNPTNRLDPKGTMSVLDLLVTTVSVSSGSTPEIGSFALRRMPAAPTLPPIGNLPPNRGLIWVTENGAMSEEAALWEASAPGASSDLGTRRRIVPALRYDNPNPRGRSLVRLDAVDEQNPMILIDRKWNVTMKTKQVNDLRRAARALAQNPGYALRIEVPNQAVLRKAEGLLTKARLKDSPIYIVVPSP